MQIQDLQLMLGELYAEHRILKGQYVSQMEVINSQQITIMEYHKQLEGLTAKLEEAEKKLQEIAEEGRAES